MDDDLRQLIHQLDPDTYARAADIIAAREWHLTVENLAHAVRDIRDTDPPAELPHAAAYARDLHISLNRLRAAADIRGSPRPGQSGQDTVAAPAGPDIDAGEESPPADPPRTAVANDAAGTDHHLAAQAPTSEPPAGEAADGGRAGSKQEKPDDGGRSRRLLGQRRGAPPRTTPTEPPPQRRENRGPDLSL